MRFDVEKDIELCKKFLALKPYRKDAEQTNKWATILKELSELHGVSVPVMFIDARIVVPCLLREFNFGKLGKRPAIMLLTKPSLVTLLHEFGHHIGLNEQGCALYSQMLFFKAKGKKATNYTTDERGYIVKKGKATKKGDEK